VGASLDLAGPLAGLGRLVAAAPPPTSIAGPGTGFATLERVFELLGLFVFAVSGGMLAVRKHFEIVGVTALAGVTALGGGVIRDLSLGDSPQRAMRDVWYLVVPLLAALVVFVGHRAIDRYLHRSVVVFDAAGLGLFTVTGAVKAAAYPTTVLGAILLAVVTAVGGGILRDVLANDPPQLFHRDSRLYAIPASAGAAVVVLASRHDWYTGAIGAGVAIAVFAVRIAALQFGWRAPTPYRSTT
jgi:uncharacterized membrane protein YeiH